MIPNDCGSRRYKGLRKPRCLAGVGCTKCWRIYWDGKAFKTKELAWATKTAKALGVESPQALLKMKWSDFQRLCRDKGYEAVFTSKRKL